MKNVSLLKSFPVRRLWRYPSTDLIPNISWDSVYRTEWYVPKTIVNTHITARKYEAVAKWLDHLSFTFGFAGSIHSENL